ncbi:MAG: hypothetical protein WC852_00610 [Candidatus Nanoarchaeia archaeon]|jgi:hypothetical protein
MNKLHKKGMIEMMESFMVIFVIFILIGMGIFVYFKVSVSSTQETHADICLSQSAKIMAAITEIPDISCKEKHTCIDAMKLDAFIQLEQKEKNKVLEGSVCPKNITIEQIYPDEPEAKGPCKGLTNSPDFYKKCKTWSVFRPLTTVKSTWASRNIETAVSLYYPATDTYGIGKLRITVYSMG